MLRSGSFTVVYIFYERAGWEPTGKIAVNKKSKRLAEPCLVDVEHEIG
jgi:hypothetical protein